MKAFVDTDEIFAGDRSPIICPVCDGYALDEECDPYAGREDLAAIELSPGPVPRCPGCRALLRPEIVWFGEPLDMNILEKSISLAQACDLLICVGSSLNVQPAASIPYLAKSGKAIVIEVNPEPTALSVDADLFLKGNAAEILPAFVEHVWGI